MCSSHGSGTSTTIFGQTDRRCCVGISRNRSVPRISSAWKSEPLRAWGVSGRRGRENGTIAGLTRHLLPLLGEAHPPVPRAAFKRWAGGRQRGRPFKDGGGLIFPRRGAALSIPRTTTPPPPPPGRPKGEGRGAQKGDAPSRRGGNCFPPAAEPPLHREANQPPPVLLH